MQFIINIINKLNIRRFLQPKRPFYKQVIRKQEPASIHTVLRYSPSKIKGRVFIKRANI
jgi:hypothetical protein